MCIWKNNFWDCQGEEVPEYLYQKFSKFFSYEEANKLAPHQDIDHAIDLKPGTELFFMRTYNLSPAELKVLEEYIEKALARGWIWESQSLAEAPVLFSPKKNGNLRLYVNYRKLNAITIKN